MKEYSYKARNVQGDLIQGKVEAESKQVASNLLTAKKLFPVDIKEESHTSFGIPFLKTIRTKDKVFFTRQLATMINAGLPLTQSLQTLYSQTQSKSIRKMIEQMLRDIESGNALSVALTSFPDVFNRTDVSMIASGEASGKLDEVLEYMAVQSEKGYKVARKIRTAFIYPAFILVVVIAVALLMLVFVLPQMQELYKSFGNAQLPLPTRILISVSEILRKYYLLVILIIIAIGASLRIYVRTDTGKYLWHSLKLRLPLIGNFLQMSYMAIFSRTMSSLVSSGVPILDSLKITSETMPNIIYEKAIMEVRSKVKQGKNLSGSIKETDLFPIMISQMVGVGENTGEIDNMLKNLAEYYSDEIDNWVKSFQSLLEPIMIVVMGGIVGGVIISIIMPIYNVGVFVKR